MTIDELIGENVRRARAAAGLEPREVAQRLQSVGIPMTPRALTRLERGEQRVAVGDLLALGTALGVAPAVLLSPLSLGTPLHVDVLSGSGGSWSLLQDSVAAETEDPADAAVAGLQLRPPPAPGPHREPAEGPEGAALADVPADLPIEPLHPEVPAIDPPGASALPHVPAPDAPVPDRVVTDAEPDRDPVESTDPEQRYMALEALEALYRDRQSIAP
jgi:transcriptional regulator with XRE-family HTH domain